jgi:hypothetical protein
MARVKSLAALRDTRLMIHRLLEVGEGLSARVPKIA